MTRFFLFIALSASIAGADWPMLGHDLARSGATAEEILATPSDFYTAMGLSELISPLRLRGMGAILGRVKRQVHERADGDAS